MSVGDKLVFDMATESESVPSVFVRKDWISINDNSNGSYSSSNTVIETSSISNSNKYANYREGYLSIPLFLTLTSSTSAGGATAFAPNTTTTSADYSLGLKNSFLHLIHSLQIEMNGTSVSQITPFQSLWSCFKLMTTLSWNDVITQGASIGFYPDTSTSFAYNGSASSNGQGVCNNINAGAFSAVSGAWNSYTPYNEGFVKRQQYINYESDGLTAPSQSAFSSLLTGDNCKSAYKSYISKKSNGTASTTTGVFQISVMANIMLKHLNSFWDKLPLIKGSYFRITLNLNNTSVTFTSAGSAGNLSAQSVSSSVGGVNPLMIASATTSNGNATLPADTYIASLAVGNKCLNTTQSGFGSSLVPGGNLASQITLILPLYSFNPVFESAYLANPVKTVIYEDIYQYTQLNVSATSGSYNFLISNGISNLKSCLVLPFHSSASGVNGGVLPIQSAFDSAGGTTSPLCLQTNFNVVVAGSNTIYNNEKYSYSFFMNQLAGANSTNENLTDGLCSSLINQLDFETSYNYYYVDISRCLPVEKGVPKSVSITGQNLSAVAVDLYCFVSFLQEIQVDCLTGARVA